MISHPAFETDPWAVRESRLDLEVLAQTGSVFALGNGPRGRRGTPEEGEPTAVPGTYLDGFYELRPLPYAEAGYGYPESGQTVVNVTDGKLIRLTVGDELFDVRYGQLRVHRRELDLRTGLLTRTVEWVAPTGAAVRITSQRLVSFAQRNVAAIHYTVEPLEDATRVAVQSELVANQPQPERSADPRAAAALRAPLVGELAFSRETSVLLAHRVKASGLRMAAAMAHVVDGPANTTHEIYADDDIAGVTFAADVAAGERLSVTKVLAYGWSGHRSSDSVRAQVGGALAEAQHTGWSGLVAAQRAYLDDFWSRGDVELDGDDELQLAVRFALFQVLQAGARGEGRAIPAKGLTGPGYDGHAFWDTESFVLPVLTYTAPDAARDALRWRCTTAELARERARQLGLAGAAFPWRTIAGRECSGYWPASTSAFHVNADIADAVIRYQNATGDERFAADVGLQLLVETARLWRSLGHHDPSGGFRINGVTGPDEYSAIADNNVYTNLMAKRNLLAAADAATAHGKEARELGVDAEETAAWRDAAADMVVPYDRRLHVHCQAENFTNHAVWDFAGTPPEMYPLLLHAPYFDLYRKQVVKQADLVLALFTCGDEFSDDEKLRDFEYYEALTVRDSSLSACTQAIVAAETGHLDLAYDYLGEAAFVDLHDLAHNTKDGLHMASLAGGWLALVCGFGGLRDHGGTLRFAPRLPEPIEHLCFRLGWRGRRLRVDVSAIEATYELEDGAALEIVHHGDRVAVPADEPVTRPIPRAPRRERPRQPPGREPRRRTPEGAAQTAPLSRAGAAARRR